MGIFEKKTAEYLLQIKAIKLQPSNPFTWASGWKSPIYCDNRKTLSFPEVRSYIRDSFADLIKDLYPKADMIAGVATGAIAHGALVADKSLTRHLFMSDREQRSMDSGTRLKVITRKGRRSWSLKI